jgi:hypothetical protein
MPASCQTSASSHNKELAGHLQGLSIAGECFLPAATQDKVLLPKNGGTHKEDRLCYGTYNASMMLDKELDEEMHSDYAHQHYRPLYLTYSQMPPSSCPHLMTTSFKHLTFRRCITLLLHVVTIGDTCPLSCPPRSVSSATLDLAALSQAPSCSAVIACSGDVQKLSKWPQFLESSWPESFVWEGCCMSTNPILSTN